MDSPKYKEFIEGFLHLAKTSEELSLAEGRVLSANFFRDQNTIYESVYRIKNVTISGKDQNSIFLRFFIPNKSEKLPVIIYFHRGGWVYGSVEEADPICRKLANHLGCIVVSVEYRLAPENPFPKPLEDCYSAMQWIAGNIGNFGGDSNNLIVCGESAGGNLAAAVALMSRDERGPPLSAQVLICPVISSTINQAAFENCVDRHFITQDILKFYWNMYLKSPEDTNNPYASPDRAKDLTKLPPALIITAEYDPLQLEGESYAMSLRKAGVPVVLKCVPGVIHGFIDLPIYEEQQKTIWIEQIRHLLVKLGTLAEN